MRRDRLWIDRRGWCGARVQVQAAGAVLLLCVALLLSAEEPVAGAWNETRRGEADVLHPPQ